MEKAKVVEHLNMQLMTVDSSVEMKYMDILQEDDEDKRKELEDGVIISLSTSPNVSMLSNVHYID